MAGTVWKIPDAVDAVVFAPDDGWWYHPKHVEQFPDKINCVLLHLVGYILEYLTSNHSKQDKCKKNNSRRAELKTYVVWRHDFVSSTSNSIQLILVNCRCWHHHLINRQNILISSFQKCTYKTNFSILQHCPRHYNKTTYNVCPNQ